LADRGGGEGGVTPGAQWLAQEQPQWNQANAGGIDEGAEGFLIEIWFSPAILIPVRGPRPRMPLGPGPALHPPNKEGMMLNRKF